ncbi:hypothetical protein AB0O63_02555 [Streptomyces cyaneofuscatus]|uniref:hypothetical protein n=1 Tax=Streptomyces cyaneofuscatus TaxID=66883 RepID=UPI003448D72D
MEKEAGPAAAGVRLADPWYEASAAGWDEADGVGGEAAAGAPGPGEPPPGPSAAEMCS